MPLASEQSHSQPPPGREQQVAAIGQLVEGHTKPGSGRSPSEGATNRTLIGGRQQIIRSSTGQLRTTTARRLVKRTSRAAPLRAPDGLVEEAAERLQQDEQQKGERARARPRPPALERLLVGGRAQAGARLEQGDTSAGLANCDVLRRARGGRRLECECASPASAHAKSAGSQDDYGTNYADADENENEQTSTTRNRNTSKPKARERKPSCQLIEKRSSPAAPFECECGCECECECESDSECNPTVLSSPAPCVPASLGSGARPNSSYRREKEHGHPKTSKVDLIKLSALTSKLLPTAKNEASTSTSRPNYNSKLSSSRRFHDFAFPLVILLLACATFPNWTDGQWTRSLPPGDGSGAHQRHERHRNGPAMTLTNLGGSLVPSASQTLDQTFEFVTAAPAKSQVLPVAAPLQQQQQQQQQHTQDVVPYKTFYVTQACEWKSNLFVPKSNDIHFAQPQQQQQQVGLASANQRQQLDIDPREPQARIILSTSQKALILALPISLGHSFAGYETACSIRLIVPRNMRILAKLTSRGLTFGQHSQAPPSATLPFGEPTSGWSDGDGGGAALGTGARSSHLWLNVSQNQFSETEQRVVETEGNVLGFRFLLERFANRREPEIRFQVVLTAFQTFGENSDFNQLGNAPPNSLTPPGADSHQSAQFICDSQRLISAHLACDGYKNCQDGLDEEPATCLVIRQQHNTSHQQQPQLPRVPARNQTLDGEGHAKSSSASEPAQTGGGFFLVQLFRRLTRDVSSPLLGFLLGFLFLLLLLICCLGCCYWLLLAVRRFTSGEQEGRDDGQLDTGAGLSASRRARLRRRLEALRMLGRASEREGAHEHESDSLAEGQNLENAARQKARSLLEQSSPPLVDSSQRAAAQQQQQLLQQQSRQIQSILKRPAAAGEFMGAPLARFETIPAGGGGGDESSWPPAPPPRAPSRGQPAARSAASQQQDQLASPRRGALASSLTSARSSGRFASALAAAGAADFRPTPAARTQQQHQQLPGGQGPLTSPPSVQPAAYTSSRSQQQQPSAAAAASPSPGPGTSREQLQQSGDQAQEPRQQQEGDRLKFKSHTTKLEQTSTKTGSERVTVYQYSSNMAQYSESYLLKQQRQLEERRQHSGAGPARESSASRQVIESVSETSLRTATSPPQRKPPEEAHRDDDQKPPELPPKSRQSSLI